MQRSTIITDNLPFSIVLHSRFIHTDSDDSDTNTTAVTMYKADVDDQSESHDEVPQCGYSKYSHSCATPETNYC